VPSPSAQRKEVLSRQYRMTGDSGGSVSQRAVSSGRQIVTAAVVRAQPPAVTVSTLIKAAEASASLCALLAPKNTADISALSQFTGLRITSRDRLGFQSSASLNIQLSPSRRGERSFVSESLDRRAIFSGSPCLP